MGYFLCRSNPYDIKKPSLSSDPLHLQLSYKEVALLLRWRTAPGTKTFTTFFANPDLVISMMN